MKKLLAILLTLSILISLTACKITKDPDSFLNGVNLEEYSIVYSADAPDYNKRAAEYIAEQIEARTNLKLTVSTDDVAEQKYEIVVGETNRAISAELNARIFSSTLIFHSPARGRSVYFSDRLRKQSRTICFSSKGIFPSAVISYFSWPLPKRRRISPG